MCPGCQPQCWHWGFPALKELPIWWALNNKGI